MNYVMGLVLSLTDNASKGLNNAVDSLERLRTTAEKTGSSLENAISLSAFSVVAGKIGDTFTNIGRSIFGLFDGVSNKVQSVGQQFQILRITLNALYSRGTSSVEELNAKTENAVQNIMDFAAKTIFEVGDLTGIFTTITANGLDAFQELAGATSDTKQSLMGAITDLMTFRSDVPQQQWAIAIRNAFGGQVRSLKSALDLNPEQFIGHKWGATGNIAQDFIDLADALGVLGLSGSSFEKNITAQMSNIADIFTKFWLQVSDFGVFDILIRKTQALVQALNEAISDNEGLVESVGDALGTVLKPVVTLTTKLIGLIPVITEFVSSHPGLMKILAVTVAITGALFLAFGVILKVASAFSGLAVAYLAFGKNLGGIIKGMTLGFGKLLSFAVPLALFAVAWKMNFLGMRDIVSNFASGMSTAMTKMNEVSNRTWTGFIYGMNEMRNSDNVFDRIASKILFVKTTLQLLADAWSDNTLSEDAFLKAKSMGILPLIEAMLDLKYRLGFLVQGFKTGIFYLRIVLYTIYTKRIL